MHPAYDPNSGGGGPSANRVQAYNVKFDARQAMGDWTDEAWYTTNFDDSNWNAPNYVLSRYIAGIAATDVAWSKFEVKPNLAHLPHVKQIVPSVKGDIVLEVHKTKGNYSMDLLSPQQTKGMTLKFYIKMKVI